MYIPPGGSKTFSTGIVVSGGAIVDTLDASGKITAGGGVDVAAGQFLYSASASLLGGILGVSTPQTPDSPVLMTGSTPNHWLVCEYADRNYDWAIPQDSNPTLHFCGATQAANNYGSIRFNNTDFEIMSAKGGILLRAPSAAPTCSGPSQIGFWLDEATHDLKVVAQYSDTTAKVGTVCALT